MTSINQKPDQWRLDIIIMILYQISLVFSAQLLFVIFLDYMPSYYCNEADNCYKLQSKCFSDYDENQNITDLNIGKVDFYSAQFEYQHDCTSLKSFSLSTTTFIGTLLGNIILGQLSDHFGRRPIYLLSLFLGIPSLFLSAVVTGIVPFYIFRTLIGFSIAGTLTIGWTYATEMITPTRRLKILTFTNWPNARMIQVGLAYMFGEWRRTTIISGLLSSFAIPILWYIPESPVFLEQKKKYQEACQARNRIAEICKFQNTVEVEKSDSPTRTITLARMLRIARLRTNFLIIIFIYFYVGMAVYITDLNGADMSTNFYFGQFFAGFVLSISQLCIGLSEPYFHGRLGRRALFLGAQTVALLSYILILILLYISMKGSLVYSIVYTIAYSSQSVCLEAGYLALIELMPTDVRATIGSFANIMMKIGTIIATTTKPLKFWYEPSLFYFNLAICSIGFLVVYAFLEESNSVDLRNIGQEEETDN